MCELSVGMSHLHDFGLYMRFKGKFLFQILQILGLIVNRCPSWKCVSMSFMSLIVDDNEFEWVYSIIEL